MNGFLYWCVPQPPMPVQMLMSIKFVLLLLHCETSGNSGNVKGSSKDSFKQGNGFMFPDRGRFSTGKEFISFVRVFESAPCQGPVQPIPSGGRRNSPPFHVK